MSTFLAVVYKYMPIVLWYYFQTFDLIPALFYHADQFIKWFTIAWIFVNLIINHTILHKQHFKKNYMQHKTESTYTAFCTE